MNKVIVAGSINMDIVVFVERHPSIGETVFGTDLKYFPGSKGANQAISSAKLGVKTILIGKVGKDIFGNKLVSFLNKQNIENKISIEKKKPTGVAIIAVSNKTAHNNIVVNSGANSFLREKDIKNLNFKKGDVLVSQFEIPQRTILSFFKKGKRAGTINIFNPSPIQVISKNLLKVIDILILNEIELSIISKKLINIKKAESIYDAVKKINKKDLIVVVTLGKDGLIAFSNKEIIKILGRKVKAIDTTGARDCFVGALAANLAKGKSLFESLNVANIAASISVTKEGTGSSMPTFFQVNKEITQGSPV